MWLLALVIIGGIAAGGVILTAYEASKPKPGPPSGPSVDDSKRTKKKLTGENEKLIGLDDPSFRYQTDQGANTGMTTVKFDTTTYGDRAILQLRNETGSTRTMGDAAILGKPVIQMSGRSGYLWEYSDYDDIDKNGEKFVEVSNRFIISPSQCEDIGDYCWKKLAPHKMYNVTIPGCHPEYDPGDVWTLSGTYVINGETIENINSAVEIQSVSVHRSCLTPGETVLTCVLYDGAWSKTNSTRSRIVGAGKPQWMQNRSNMLVVASKDYTGQADYYCDGTADDIEIQDAIDRLAKVGGGSVLLTSGKFYTTYDIVVKNNVILFGMGYHTLITSPSGLNFAFIHITENGGQIRDLAIDGENTERSAYGSNGFSGILVDNVDNSLISNVLITNLYITGDYIGSGIRGKVSNFKTMILNSRVTNLSYSGGSFSAGIAYAQKVQGCIIDTITGYGIWEGRSCNSNRATNCGTAYGNSYADAGTVNACADTAAGGYNS